MGNIRSMRVTAGVRVGFWKEPKVWEHGVSPFIPKGVYQGPDLGDQIPGTRLEQPLLEGVLKFRVGVLFRPDLGKRQNLETILLLETWIPEMFEYEDWESLENVG